MPTLAERLQVLVGHGYRIERELPLGGMSRLYVARDLAVEREVVVKVLPPDLACTASTGRFQREVEVTAQLLHPNIVPVLGAGGNDELRFYVTPFVAGESLRELLAREGALPLDAVLRVLDDVLDALAYAHSRGVVHRDIKPGNILLAAGGRAMLADFGIASALSPDDDTRSDIVPGTPAYMAPEHPRDARADLWATCVVAHEMLTGARPGPGAKAGDVVRARARALGPSEARRAEALAAVVARGLSLQPERRQPSAEALQAAIARARQRRLVSRRALVAAAGVLVVALAGFAASQPTMLAARARERGREAEARFALDSAIIAYREALGHRRDDAAAQLGLARALAWRGGNADLTEATRLLRSMPGGVEGRERIPALLALAERRFPDACAQFESMTRRDSLDVQAWMGLAECRRRDGAVVEDRHSASGYAFRTSFHGAALAYERVLDRTPASALANLRIGQVLVSDANRQRFGTAPGRVAHAGMVAYPELIGDSVAYVPFPAGRAPIPESRQAALETNLRRLSRNYRVWVRLAPTDYEAHHAFALILEKSRLVSSTGEDDVSATSEMRRARTLAPTDALLPLAVAEVRLHVKSGAWIVANAMADSLLAGRAAPSASDADALAGLAALTGRLELLTRYLRIASATPKHQVRDESGREVQLSDAITNARAELMARAMLGLCDDRFHELRVQLPRLVAAMPPDSVPTERAAQLVLMKPLSLMADCVGPSTFDGIRTPDLLVSLHRSYARRGRSSLRTTMDSLVNVRQHGRPGDVAPDYALAEATLLLMAGDSAAALQRLDIALDALPDASIYLLDQPAQAGAIGRMMRLAAVLSHARGDRYTWRRWTTALETLWAGADAALAPPAHALHPEVRARGTRAARSGNGPS